MGDMSMALDTTAGEGRRQRQAGKALTAKANAGSGHGYPSVDREARQGGRCLETSRKKHACVLGVGFPRVGADMSYRL